MGCGLSKAHTNPEVLVSHGNARTLFHGRLLIVQRHQSGWPQAHIAKAMGISRKCVKTWSTGTPLKARLVCATALRVRTHPEADQRRYRVPGS